MSTEDSIIINQINKLRSIREGVPQFLFSAGVHTYSMIRCRRAIYEYKLTNPEANEVDLIINSGGGAPDDAYRIIRTFRNNFEVVNIVVPFWAKSAATLLSLGGSKIIMDEFGEFGPLDAQIGKQRDDSPEFERESALNDEHTLARLESRFKEFYESTFLRIYSHEHIKIHKNELSNQVFQNTTRFFEPLLNQIDPYRIGQKRRALDIGAQYAKRIMQQFSSQKDWETAAELIFYLVNECPDHGYVIDFDIISKFLPNVFKSEYYGDEYKEALHELSGLFIEQVDPEQQFLYVDFVVEIETEKPDLGDIEEQKDNGVVDNKKESTKLAGKNNSRTNARKKPKTAKP